MIATMSPREMLAALAWQIELGADEAIGDTPVDRYAEAAEGAAAEPARAEVPASARSARAAEDTGPGWHTPDTSRSADPVALARDVAAGAGSLQALAAGLSAFEPCDLRLGARSFVFSDGDPAARVMVVGEAPGRDEDLQGRPFVGRAGQPLDRMFEAIGLSRTSAEPASALYITNVLPWRPPQNRDPSPEEIAMMRPFLERHIALASPDVVVAMGRHALVALTGAGGIRTARGRWTQAAGRPCLPMLHPAFLLRTPASKRDAWADLLALKARLSEGAA
jgi:uracil-DNA glycosylase